MGRGGGSHGGGGGHHSSHSSGGHHSSGGYHSSRGSSYHSSSYRSSNYHSGRSSHVTNNYYYGNPRPRPQYYYGGAYHTNPYRGSGCVTAIIWLMVFMVIIGMISCSAGGNRPMASDYDIEVVEKIKPDYKFDDDVIISDQLGWIDSENTLVNGAKYLYNETGIQFYVCTQYVNGDESDEYLDKYCIDYVNQEFGNDGGYAVLFIFSADGEEDYYDYVAYGKEAGKIINLRTLDYFWDLYDSYYNTDVGIQVDNTLTHFSDGMTGKEKNKSNTVWIVLIVCGTVIAIVLILFNWWKKKKAQKNKETEDQIKILNTPLESFGTSPVDDLASKYDKMESSTAEGAAKAAEDTINNN